ncbi:MAG: tyrosine-type recombinase/integrase [Candidatus Bathyarchaeia archaeon]
MSRVENFLKMFTSQNTVRAYSWSLTEFFKTVYGENEGKLEEHAERYFSEKRDYEQDIQRFLVAINGKPPKTVRLMLTAVKSFLIENDVELPAKFWRRLIKRVRGSRALTLDKVPSNVELRRIITHMPVHGKALFLTLASSGMRIGEALQLKPEDFEFDKEPVKVNIRGEYTKTGNSRIAFISKEAKEAIEEWLKVRSRYIEAAAGKSHKYGKPTQDQRLFPFEANTAYAVWKNALRKSGYLKKDTQTNRHTIHPHVLRKFFRTKLGSVLPVDVVEALMGHEGYLTEVYRRYSHEDLAKFYMQGEAALTVFAEAEEVAKLRVEIEERNKQLQQLVNGLTAENLELKQRLVKVEEKLAEIEKMLS